MEFNEGVMWEENPWKIEKDVECSDIGGTPCRHCNSFKTITHKRSDGSTYENKSWICPKVIIVKNEGGYASTGLCGDCAFEALKALCQFQGDQT